MRDKKYYEWSFRTLDKFGDCYDLDHTDDLSSCNRLNDNDELELVLNFGNEADGITMRAYALVDHRNCKLPETFEQNPDGYKVPKYIRKQFDKWVKECGGDLGGISQADEEKQYFALNEHWLLNYGRPHDDNYDPKSNPNKVNPNGRY